MNNKTLTIVNAVLIVAVLILFVLQFSGGSDTKTKVQEEEKQEVIKELPEYKTNEDTKEIKIAYVNSDTVAAYFEFSKDIEYKLKKKQASAEAKLKGLYQKYEQERKAFEKEAPIMGQSEMQRRAQEIGMLEQQIMQKEQELSTKLAQAEAEIMTDYVYKTNEYMQQIGKELGYDYIMSYRVGGPMLYANSDMDITNQIVEHLNEAYKKSKETKQPSSK